MTVVQTDHTSALPRINFHASCSARIRVDLWLRDVDLTEVNADVLIGPVESAPPFQTITIGKGAAADQVLGSVPPPNLERYHVGDAGEPTKLPRTYVTLGRTSSSRP